MKQLLFKSRNGRGSVAPYVTIAHGGGIMFSVALAEMLKIKKGDFVTVAEHEGDVYIAKSMEPAYRVQVTEKNCRIQSSALVLHLVDVLDLPVAKDKKKSVQLDVSKSPTIVGVIEYYKIMTV